MATSEGGGFISLLRKSQIFYAVKKCVKLKKYDCRMTKTRNWKINRVMWRRLRWCQWGFQEAPSTGFGISSLLSLIRRTTSRETCPSRHNGGRPRAHLKPPRTSQQYGIEGFKEGPQGAPWYALASQTTDGKKCSHSSHFFISL